MFIPLDMNDLLTIVSNQEDEFQLNHIKKLQSLSNFGGLPEEIYMIINQD